MVTDSNIPPEKDPDSPHHHRRVRRVRVTRSALAGMMMEGTHEIKEGVPKDAVVVGMTYAPEEDFFEVMIHSKQYNVVEEMSEVPTENVRWDFGGNDDS